MNDTLYELFSYTKPKHNIIFGSDFLFLNLFNVVYDNTDPNKCKICIIPNDDRFIQYCGLFHVFVSTNKGKVLSTADVSSLSIDTFYMDDDDPIRNILGTKVRLHLDTVMIEHDCYGVFIDAQLDTYTGKYATNTPPRTIYIILLEKDK